MNKEDLYPLIGKYLNGYKIVKVEEDPFVKWQINLWTDEWKTEYFGDKCLVKFYVRFDANSVKIYQELVDKENYRLKYNWNKLKEIIKKNFVAQGCFISYEWNDLLNELLNKMEELEKKDDRNRQRAFQNNV